MKGWGRRAICAAAGSLALAGVLAAANAAAVDVPLPAFTADSRSVDLGQAFSLPQLAYGPLAAARPALSDTVASVSLVTGLDLELGYKVDLTGRFDPLDQAHTFDGLFLSPVPVGSSYASLASGGNFVGAAAALAGDLHVGFGVASLSPGFSTYTPDAYTALARIGGRPLHYDLRSGTSLLAGVSWQIGSWGELGVMASNTHEHDGILGIASPGSNTNTSALGISARVSLGSGWVTTASYSEGISQLDLKPGRSPFVAGDEFHTRSYGIAIAKNGLFGDDALGLAVSRPALGSDGGEFITMPGGNPRFFMRNSMMPGSVPETDIEVGYVTTFLDGALALQTNASYQMNFAGQYGANAVQLLSRARIKF